MKVLVNTFNLMIPAKNQTAHIYQLESKDRHFMAEEQKTK